MWRKFDQLEDESGFLPWAKVIVRFESLKARRTAARDKLWFSSDVIEIVSEDDFETDSDETMSLERGALDLCLENLEDSQRDLVLLPYRDHGAIVKLAEKNKKSVNSYYKKIGRIREKLSLCIEGKLRGRLTQ